MRFKKFLVVRIVKRKVIDKGCIIYIILNKFILLTIKSRMLIRFDKVRTTSMCHFKYREIPITTIQMTYNTYIHIVIVTIPADTSILFPRQLLISDTHNPHAGHPARQVRLYS